MKELYLTEIKVSGIELTGLQLSLKKNFGEREEEFTSFACLWIEAGVKSLKFHTNLPPQACFLNLCRIAAIVFDQNEKGTELTGREDFMQLPRSELFENALVKQVIFRQGIKGMGHFLGTENFSGN